MRRRLESVVILAQRTLKKAVPLSMSFIVVRTGRVELPFPCGSQILSLVRLPIPPRSQWTSSF